MKLRNKKTGETGYLELEKGDDEKYIGLRVYKNDFVYKRYHSLAELNEEWEDYEEPSENYIEEKSGIIEPLFKDEKVRKAVRTWAEANDVDRMKVAPFAVFDIESTAGIYFRHRVIDDNSYDEFRYYTIPELCGEEE